MGGFGIRTGEQERIHQMLSAGMRIGAIARQLKRSHGFVTRVSQSAPARTSAVPATLSAERKALADLVIGLDIPKAQKLKVLDAIL